MALAGLKKQFNKANQFMSEKIGGVEGTKLTEEYTEMERKTDMTNELVEELLTRTKEYLQPNPASRTKLMVSSKIKGSRTHNYPQPEGLLGETMCRYANGLGESSLFSRSLTEMGEALKEMAEVKYALEDTVKQNFLEPLTHLQTKDLKDVMHHRKKLEGRRLDFDCKKRKKLNRSHVTDDEIRLAEDKFEESYNLASMGMHNLLQNDIEQISQIAALSEALYEYHSQCANILESLTSRLIEQKNEAAAMPLVPYVPKKLHELNLGSGEQVTSPTVESTGHQYNGAANHPFFNNPMRINPHMIAASPATSPTKQPPSSLFLGATNSGARSPNASPLPSPVRSPARSPVQRGPCVQALYDFEPENPSELGFKEGDIIQLNNKIDDNWFEGTHNGRTGLFPVSYVQVLVPISQ